MKKIIILGSLFLSLNLHALVKAFVDKTNFYAGDKITLTIEVGGENIQFPDITNIAGSPIISTSNFQSHSIFNNKKTIKISKSYTFLPTNSLTIPSLSIKNNGKQETTKPIKISKLKPSQNKVGDDFILTIQINDKQLYVGETTILLVTLKQKKSVVVDKINIEPLKVNGINLETDYVFNKSSDGIYNINTLEYKLTPKIAGDFEIGAARAKIGKNFAISSFFSNLKWKSIYSNSLKIKVLPLPENVDIFGDYKISINTDKEELKSGEALNLTININGTGNIYDIEKFDLKIGNATIYSDEPTINGSNWQQKIAIIASGDFTIPSFELRYFDKKTKTTKTIKTTAKLIRVKQEPKNPLTGKLIQNQEKIPAKIIIKEIVVQKYNYYYLIFGIFLGFFGFWIWNFIKNYQSPKTDDLLKKIKRTRNDKKLFALLLPLNNPQLDKIMQKLEENIYQGKNHKINKKEIIYAIKSS